MNFCNGILKLSGVIKKFITEAQVYEDEDFQPSLYNLNLCTELSEQKVIAALKDSENDIQKKLREMDARSEKFEDLTAVFQRIKFERLLLQSMQLLFPAKSLSPSEMEMAEISKLLTSAAELMPAIKRSVDRGTQPDPKSRYEEITTVFNLNDIKPFLGDTPNVMGFSPMVNQRLLPPTFPRYTKIKDRKEALNFLEELSHNLKLACKIVHCTNYQSALNFFMEFSKKSGPCLLSRSVLQVLYLPPGNGKDGRKVFGATSLADVLKESVKLFIAPPVLMPKNPLFNNPQVSLSDLK